MLNSIWDVHRGGLGAEDDYATKGRFLRRPYSTTSRMIYVFQELNMAERP